jgi:hypothetical protein
VLHIFDTTEHPVCLFILVFDVAQSPMLSLDVNSILCPNLCWSRVVFAVAVVLT